MSCPSPGRGLVRVSFLPVSYSEGEEMIRDLWEERCKDKRKRRKTDKVKKTLFKKSPTAAYLAISNYKCDLDIIKVELKQEAPTLPEGDSKQLIIEPSDLIKLELEDHNPNVEFRHGANQEMKRYLDTRAEETKLKKEPKVFGRKPLPPYRKTKRGTLGVSYKLAMDDLEETIEIRKIGLKKTNVDDQGFSSSKPKMRFKHYKEFIAPKQEFYDPTVISRLLSPWNSLEKKRFSSEGDVSKEIVDVDHISRSVKVKFDNSMPLIK